VKYNDGRRVSNHFKGDITVEESNIIVVVLNMHVGMRLRYYATSRKVMGSIPDEVLGIFNWLNPSNRAMALGSIQESSLE
jgi:hypothetical protein